MARMYGKEKEGREICGNTMDDFRMSVPTYSMA